MNGAKECLGLSESYILNLFQKWLDLMYVHLSFMIAWPE